MPVVNDFYLFTLQAKDKVELVNGYEKFSDASGGPPLNRVRIEGP
jgi:hypothetical protein